MKTMIFRTDTIAITTKIDLTATIAGKSERKISGEMCFQVKPNRHMLGASLRLSAARLAAGWKSVS